MIAHGGYINDSNKAIFQLEVRQNAPGVGGICIREDPFSLGQASQ
jgi:UDP-N-acetyl-D-mannosaminuronate dehydrogenase